MDTINVEMLLEKLDAKIAYYENKLSDLIKAQYPDSQQISLQRGKLAALNEARREIVAMADEAEAARYK